MNPGIHSLSFEQYLAAAGVSASMLRILSERTPAHLKCWLDGEKPPSTPAQRFGTLVHRCVLEPDSVHDAFYVRPAGLQFTTKEGKVWRDSHTDKPILTDDETAQILAMVASVHAHPSASRLLKNAEFERSIFVEDDEGTLRKLRPDILPKGGNILPDLKTCEDASDDAFSKAIFDYGYYRQAAYYQDGCELAGRNFEVFAFIAVEKSPPYAVAVYNLDPLAVEAGRALYQRDLAVFRSCVAANRWPAYSDQVECIGLPPWAMRQMEAIL